MSDAAAEHRIVLVTGAARGQGLAIVRRFLAAGARVVACDLADVGLDSVIGELGDDRVIARSLDVTDAGQWHAVLEEIRQTFGALTTLVNNAGVLHRTALAEETVEGMERAWRVNCLGPFLGIRAARELLSATPGASVVNTCSTGAIRPFPEHAAYASSKAALLGLTRVAAVELAPLRIRVNAVLPGPVRTPMLDEATVAYLDARSPSGRIGEADDIAAAVAYLASPEASYVTGAELVVDGGQTLTVK